MRFMHHKRVEHSLIKFVLISAIWTFLIPKCKDFAFWWVCLVLDFLNKKMGKLMQHEFKKPIKSHNWLF